MRVGTKSILFGVHHFILHPLLVWISWKLIYGKNPNIRETICIILHDIGYIFCKTMDGEDGERHPELGGKIANILFGKEFGDLVKFHSRSMALIYGESVSKLCLPDKLSFLLYPKYLYIFLGRMSGEIEEYKERMNLNGTSDSEWYDITCIRAISWAEKNIGQEYIELFQKNFTSKISIINKKIDIAHTISP